MPTQQIGQEWQLDRLDQRDVPLDGEFTYEADGTGVRIYVVDYGVRATHQEFGDRVEAGFSAVGGDPHTDAENHGTAVASAAAGETVGVAKGATVVPVQVSESGPILTSAVDAAADWIISNHPGGPAVVNMSIGATNNGFVGAARSLTDRGFIVVAAAMNDAIDAEGVSPANAPGVITVAAITDEEEHRSTSNFGPYVDIYAPGTNNWVAAGTADDAYELRHATSHATPLVSGVIACLLQQFPNLTRQQVRDYLVASSTKQRIANVPSSTPNRLLYSPLVIEEWLAHNQAGRHHPVRRPVRSFEQQGGVWGLGNPWPTLGEPFDPPDPTPTVLEGWGVPI